MNIISQAGDQPRTLERLRDISVQVRVEQGGTFVLQQVSILAINEFYRSSVHSPPPKRTVPRDVIGEPDTYPQYPMDF